MARWQAGQRIAGNIKAQSTLEYILVLVVVLLAIIAFAGGALKPAVNNTLQQSGDTIDRAVSRVAEGLNLPSQ